MKKERIKENYTATLNTSILGLFASIKNYFEDLVSDTQFIIEYFYRLRDLKKCRTGIIPDVLNE